MERAGEMADGPVGLLMLGGISHEDACLKLLLDVLYSGLFTRVHMIVVVESDLFVCSFIIGRVWRARTKCNISNISMYERDHLRRLPLK